MKKLIIAFLIWKYIEKIVNDSYIESEYAISSTKSLFQFLITWIMKNLPFVSCFYKK